ncbi:MAG: prepilin peptidase [Acidimicrobiales bacterium]
MRLDLAEPSTLILLAWLGLLGLCIGSFLNVVIWRVPQGMSLSRPPSHCPACGQPLRPWHNVPLLSWLALRGRCAHCATPIPVRYPLVEVGCAALFVLVGLTRSGWELAPYAIASAGMLALSIIDLEHFRLPDRVLGPTLALTLAGFCVAAVGSDAVGSAPLLRALVGAAAATALLGAIHLVQPAGMGFGDVKLAALCGLVLGWRGLGYVPVGLFAAFLLGAVVGVAVLAAGRGRGRKTAIPFGPFLCGAALGVALVGDPLVEAVGSVLLAR